MKKTKGISLIVLVITIIVMIIISGTIILSLSNTNVIDQAEVAADKYNLSQLKEAVNLDRTNALLTRYNTTEGVNISVKELLGLTDSDAIELTSTNTMPANMPAGKYYKLDVTKYGMQSAGTVENNTIKGAYVINDNYDIYYVVEGTTSEVGKEIDDEKVIQLITGLFDGTITDLTVAIENLKKELHMENIESNNLFDLFYYFDENERNKDNIIYYFYPIDRIYLLAEGSSKIEYISKEENEELYKYAAKIEQIRKELETAFVGESLTAIKEKYKNGILEQYILNSCASIKEVQLRNLNEGYEQYFIDDITYEYNNIDMDSFCSFNTFNFVYDENGICILVFPSDGA